MEGKIKELAHLLVTSSLQVEKNEKVYISYQSSNCHDLVLALLEEIKEREAFAFYHLLDNELDSYSKLSLTPFDIACEKELEEAKMDFFDSYIYIRYLENDYELSNMDKNMLQKRKEALKKAQDIRVNHRKWVLLNYPSSQDAAKAHMNTRKFRDFAFNAMTIDYKKMKGAMEPLRLLMERTDQVHIVGNGTDLTFSIKNMKAIPCVGEKNIPDGEIYTAPVLQSVNGTITYNTPSPYQGHVFHNVSLTFENGKIINATCDEGEEKINDIFDQDEGARYVGEFSFGLNPMISEPMGDILYDEKIYGSIHFTPGEAYLDADNGNRSSVHWDLVLIQRKEYGGGEIYFDGKLIRKDGIFTLDELKPLNKI